VRTDQQITDEIRTAVHRFQPGVYAWLAVMISAITLPLLALFVSIQLNERAVENERTARVAGERAMCIIVVTLDSAYKEDPPKTPAGKNVAEGMANLRLAYHCDER